MVVIGSGAAGMPAAISARDGGASVIVVEQNWDVGGRAMASGSFIALGANDALQRQEGTTTVYGGPDSPEILFRDLVDWSVVTDGGKGTYRHNTRELARAAADNAVATRDFLLANGVKFKELSGSHGQSGVSASRRAQTLHEAEEKESPVNPPGRNGVGLIRPLEESAR
ncbi:MAG TPA: FAD-binding protein, partial [Candidatus Methylomirabilis sp.]